VDNLRNLHPVLRSLADSGESLTNALNLAATFPFPAAGVPRACPGDYCNAFFIIDLTLSTLDTNFLSGTPGQGSLYGVEGVLGRSAGIAGEATDPLRTPSQPAPAVAPDVASPPSADAPGAPQLLAPILGAGR
jgi:phospholipid/cholesterol/gamma-HCH transport system substrate-binding protein